LSDTKQYTTNSDIKSLLILLSCVVEVFGELAALSLMVEKVADEPVQLAFVQKNPHSLMNGGRVCR
jgi:hypothetical protein